MPTTVNEPATTDDAATFEDRLLAALLDELVAGGPEMTRPAVAVPRRRSHGRTALVAAAATALFAGATWMLVGGADDNPVSVSAADATTSSSANDGPYFDWPGRDMFRSDLGAAGAWSLPDSPPHWFRPVDGGRNRALLEVRRRDDLWHAGGNEGRVTPGGREIWTTADWAGDADTVFASWEEGGVVWSAQQILVASSGQALEAIDSATFDAFVDGLDLDGSDVAQRDPRFAEVVDPDRWVSATLWGLGSSADGGPDDLGSNLRVTPGSTDLAQLPGRSVSVRGTTGVLGARTTPIDTSTTVTWVEDGATVSLSMGSQGRRDLDADVIAAANALVKVTKAEFEARHPEGAPVSQRLLLLEVPRTEATGMHVRTRSFDAAGTAIPAMDSDITFGSPTSKQYVVPVPDDAASMVVWIGESPEPPACAAPIDVTGATAEEPARAPLDLDCVS